MHQRKKQQLLIQLKLKNQVKKQALKDLLEKDVKELLENLEKELNVLLEKEEKDQQKLVQILKRSLQVKEEKDLLEVEVVKNLK